MVARQAESLFPVKERARARRTDPLTSVFAAQGIDCTHREAMVLTAFINGPCTHDELIDRVRDLFGQDIRESTIRTGCSALMKAIPGRPALVEVVGMGKSRIGNPARIYGRIT